MPDANPATPSARDRLATRLGDELGRPQHEAIVAFGRELAARYGETVAAVLLYGSCHRSASVAGVIDFYVLVDRYPVAGMSAAGAVAARALPPTVQHQVHQSAGRTLRGKVALITLDQVARRSSPDGYDSSVWARFCQPMALVYGRSPADADRVVGLMTDAVIAAGAWAARLGPRRGTARDYWLALFRATYAAELRVETADRAADILAASPARFDAMLADAWAALGWTVNGDTAFANPLSGVERRAAGRAWRRRRFAGKTLNGVRLMKAAFTFEGGTDYITWKIERHSGRRYPLTPFRRRHPLLAAPLLVWWAIRHRMVR